jgi:hypothetical protein
LKFVGSQSSECICEDRVDVMPAESVVLHALEEEADGRGVGDVQVRGRRVPAPPVRRPSMRPRPLTITEPESPFSEKAQDFKSNGRIAHSFEVSALPS